MKVIQSIAFVFVISLPICFYSGCGGPPRAELVPVTGTVNIDGHPVSGIMVKFVPQTLDDSIAAPTSQAISDNQGKFDLFTTKNEQGAIIGPHLVLAVDTEEDRPAQGQPNRSPSRIAPKYSLDGVTVVVTENEPVVVDLTRN